MKKILLIAVAVLGLAVSTSSAQPRALGIRGTYGVELSYQHTMTGSNFLEADLGFLGDNKGFYATGIYDFMLAETPYGFGFYAGPGAQLGFYNDANDKGVIDLGVAGQVGVEYNFSIPLQLSLDWRPVYHFNDGFGWSGFALGLRYKF